MSGKKIYTLIIVSMTLLAAFGAWVMFDGAYAYNHRTRLEVQSESNPTFYVIPFN